MEEPPVAPALFQPIVDIAQNRANLIAHGWTSEHRRHYSVVYNDLATGKTNFVKMCDPKQVDLDDCAVWHGLQRTVWFANVIELIRTKKPDFPVWVSPIADQNVEEKTLSKIPQIVMEYNQNGPICDKLPPPDQTSADFTQLCEAMADCHAALQMITPRFLAKHRQYYFFPVFLPHECLGRQNKLYVELLRRFPYLGYWQRLLNKLERRKRHEIMHDARGYVLDCGAFELKNFFRTNQNAKAELIDTEFAGWARPHSALAKAFIRLWANAQRPDLAKMLLRTYVEKYEQGGDSDFFSQFCTALLCKIRSGTFYDRFRRGHWLPNFPAHKLRRELKKIILAEDFDLLYI